MTIQFFFYVLIAQSSDAYNTMYIHSCCHFGKKCQTYPIRSTFSFVEKVKVRIVRFYTILQHWFLSFSSNVILFLKRIKILITCFFIFSFTFKCLTQFLTKHERYYKDLKYVNVLIFFESTFGVRYFKFVNYVVSISFW